MSLFYNYIGHPLELQLLCFFDAGFTARADGSSQGGYILMLVNKQLFTSGEDGEYHVLDWRSFRTPRVTRSSLAAEAQAGGQAADSVDFACRYWHALMHPELKLKELLKAPSTLVPTMVTDAKALYDSYHREGVSSSVVDKRVSLEIRVMKEMMEELGGQLRWMSSERQIADGLTKESARTLLAARLRHRRLKLTWDPDYVASKKKSKKEKEKAIAKTTQLETTPNDVAAERFVPAEEPIPEKVKLSDYPEILEYEEQQKFEETPATAYLAQNAKALTYVFAMSHGGSCSKNNLTGRMPNVFLAVLMFSLLAMARGQQCEKGEEKEEKGESYEQLWLWLAILALIHIILMTGIFIAGRWSCHHKVASKPMTKEVEIQKNEPIVHARLRELLNLEKNRADEAQKSAQESRAALNLQIDEVQNLRALTTDAHRLFRDAIMEMELHSSLCPFMRPVVTASTGECWHHESCHIVRQITSNLMTRRACAYCASLRPPPDRIESNSGTSLRREVDAWLADADPWRPL